jgi:integrase
MLPAHLRHRHLHTLRDLARKLMRTVRPVSRPAELPGQIPRNPPVQRRPVHAYPGGYLHYLSAIQDRAVARNVTTLVKLPRGQRAGRPSKSLTLEQAMILLDAAKGTRLEAYITLSLLAGLRTEEARALRWDHVVTWMDDQWRPVAETGFDHGQVAVFVWRSQRAGGDTKRPSPAGH